MILEVTNLGFHYRDQRNIFHGVSFGIRQGEIITILGPNGAGKSTLLNCLANLVKPTSGQIMICDQPLEQMSLTQVAKHIGYVPQTHHPAYAYTTRDFVVMGRTAHIGFFSKPQRKDYAAVDEALHQLSIAHLAHKPYTEISGGERQQVTIARVLVQKPRLVLLDEPTSHLDYGNQLRTVKMIKQLAEQNFAIIMTTHIPDHAILLGDKVGILDRDGTMTFGHYEEIMTEKTLSRIYNVNLKMVYVEEIKRTTCIAVSV